MRHYKQAVSLLEVLIAVALLGIVASFLIPKVMQANQDAQKKARLKETFSQVSRIIYDGVLEEELPRVGLYNYLKSHLNYTKACDTNFQNEKCYSVTVPVNADNGGGFVLPNGVILADINISISSDQQCQTCLDGWWVDWNGDQEPNIEGKDRLWIALSYGTINGLVNGKTYKPGQVGTESLDSQPLFKEVMGL